MPVSLVPHMEMVTALRIQALSRSIILTTITSILSIMPLACNIVVYATMELLLMPLIPGVSACASYEHLSPQTDHRLLWASRACAIASDIIVIVTTWLKTVHGVGCSTSMNCRGWNEGCQHNRPAHERWCFMLLCPPRFEPRSDDGGP